MGFEDFVNDTLSAGMPTLRVFEDLPNVNFSTGIPAYWALKIL
jgi:hypothetical protein